MTPSSAFYVNSQTFAYCIWKIFLRFLVGLERIIYILNVYLMSVEWGWLGLYKKIHDIIYTIFWFIELSTFE